MGRDIPEYSYKSRRQRPAVDPAMRRMALGAGAVGVVLIGVALLWSGVRPHGFGPPPEITAPTTPLRVAPADPGGLTVPGASEAIMSGDDAGPAPTLAPAPPAPALAQLQQQSGVPVVTPTAPPPAPAAPPAPGAPAAAAPAGPASVQLAATASQAAAEQKWSQFLGQMPALVGTKKPEFIPAVVNGQTVWRLRLTGFADTAAAAAFCAQVVAAGGACTVATF
jgi:hypothetical protein